MDDSKPHVTIYTDGGSEPNPGPGGWGALLIVQHHRRIHEKELSGADPNTTNNRMELTAAIEALRTLKEPSDVTLYTDSEYLRQGISEWIDGWIRRGWRRKDDKPVQNVDLWQALHAETQRHDIDWQWVRGHAGNEYNERVDRLATAARRALTGQEDDPAPAPTAVDERARRYQIALRVSVPQAGGTGGYAFRIYDLQSDTQETFTGTAETTTSNRLILIAAEDALSRIPPEGSAAVFCPDNYLQQGMTGWVKGWQRSNWKTKDGSPVKNQPEWRRLYDAAMARDVAWLPKRSEPDHLSAELDTLASGAARGEV